MTDPVKEQLSACLDGELPEGELDLLLKQVGRDPQLRASLGRYALIGESLRGQRPAVAPNDFAARIAAAVAAEPTSGNVSPALGRTRAPAVRWLRPAAGMAVAAGVAAVAILSLQQPQGADPAASYVASNPTAAPIEEPSADASYIVPAATGTTGFVPAARLTNYVVAHSEYSTPLGRRSVLSGVLSEEEADGAAETTESADIPETVVITQP